REPDDERAARPLRRAGLRPRLRTPKRSPAGRRPQHRALPIRPSPRRVAGCRGAPAEPSTFRPAMSDPSSVYEAPAAATRLPWRRAIADAIRGKEHDHTTGPLTRGIVLLAIPMVLEMAMESLFALCDAWFVKELG